MARRRQAQAKRVSEPPLHAARNVSYYGDISSGNKIVKGGKFDLTRLRQVPLSLARKATLRRRALMGAHLVHSHEDTDHSEFHIRG